jgi:hypothetical protein
MTLALNRRQQWHRLMQGLEIRLDQQIHSNHLGPFVLGPVTEDGLRRSLGDCRVFAPSDSLAKDVTPSRFRYVQ